jgi:hypothetical protein
VPRASAAEIALWKKERRLVEAEDTGMADHDKEQLHGQGSCETRQVHGPRVTIFMDCLHQSTPVVGSSDNI